MPFIQATRDAVLKPLATVVGIVERRNTMPILANVLIKKHGSQISFLANDLEVQITANADFGIGEQDFATTTNARKFLDILRSLPDTGEVKISQSQSQANDGDDKLIQNDNKLIIQSGRSRFALQTLPADNYPTVSQAQSWDASFKISQKALKNLFSMVSFAMAQQDIRFYLNGMLLVLEPGHLYGVTTDGHRLAHNGVAIDEIQQDLDVIIPRKTVHEIQRLLSDSEESLVQIDISTGQIRFSFDEIQILSKLVEGKFPDYKRVIPSGYTNYFDIPRETLYASLQRTAIMTTDKLKGVKLQLADDLLKITSSNAEQEEAKEELLVEYQAQALDMAFNVTYLLDVLANVKVETIRWYVNQDGNSSVLLTIPEQDQFKYVVMPMRI